MPGIMQVFVDKPALFILLSMGISLFSVLLLAVSLWRTGRILKNYRSLMRGMQDTNLEELLNAHLARVKQGLERVNDMEIACKKLEQKVEKAIQKVGVVRFNAFHDTGSDLSFAVALLDLNGDGVVISSIFGRDESRTYAKPIKNGTSTYNLSDEEQQAVSKALAQSNRRFDMLE